MHEIHTDCPTINDSLQTTSEKFDTYKNAVNSVPTPFLYI